MAVSGLINLSALLDDAKCFDLVRQLRWPQGVRCPGCDSAVAIRNGRFDDLTGTVLVSMSTIVDGIAAPLFDGLPTSASRCL
jgi:hypothetical protein